MQENSNYRWYHLKGGLYKQTTQMWGRSSAGRASRSQCEGREFDPPRLHQMTDSFPPVVDIALFSRLIVYY